MRKGKIGNVKQSIRIVGICLILISVPMIQSVDIEKRRYNREKKFKPNIPYHARDSIHGTNNISNALMDYKIQDESIIDGSYISLSLGNRFNFTFKGVSNTGVFLLYYIISCKGSFLINKEIVQPREGFDENFEMKAFLNNKSVIHIIIETINFSLHIAEMFGLDMLWLDRSPMKNLTSNEHKYWMNWFIIENIFKKLIGDEIVL